MRHFKMYFAIIVLLGLVLCSGTPSPGSYAIANAGSTITWGDGSLLFEENVGQFHPDARFQVRGAGVTLWLADDALWITIAAAPEGEQVRPTRGVHLRLSFADANPHPRLEPFARQDIVINYYRGNDPSRWHTHVPVWGGVRYADLYPGVDLEIAGASGHLAWRLVSRRPLPATRKPPFALQVEGAKTVKVEGGLLRMETGVGDLSLPLVAWQGTSSPRVKALSGEAFLVTEPFAAASAAGVAPQAAADALLLGTYLGGSEYDRINAIAADDSGAVYVTGTTFSPDFPTEGAGATSSLKGNCDAFVTKLGKPATLFRPVYSTYLGGSYKDPSGAYDDFMTDNGLDIAIDDDGAAYVGGYTWSDDFPTTAGAYDTSFNGPAVSPDASPERPGWDGFIAKLDASGNLAYSTYLGGSGYDVPGDGRGGGDDEVRGIAVRDGIIYATGSTRSSDFPTTSGAFDRVFSDVSVGLSDDAFVVKLNPAGNGTADLIYGTFVGGGYPSYGNDIAVDSAGMVYVTGYTEDPGFPVTPGAYDTRMVSDDIDAFMFKMNPAGNGSADMVYSTFLGADRGTGTGWDYGHAIAVDNAGHVYIVGSTNSPDFPTTPGAFDTTCGSDGNCNYTPGWGAADDVFIAEINPAGSGTSDLLYSTFLGGQHIDGWIVDWADIVLDDDGDVYVTGRTSSSDFPTTSDAYDTTLYSGDIEAFVAHLRLRGKGQEDLVYSTFLGGTKFDYGLGIALAAKGVVWVAGETGSSDFPTTSGVFDRTYGGNYDGFVVKMAVPPSPDLSTSTKRANRDTAAVGDVITFTVTLVNTGIVSATASFTDILPAELSLRGVPAASSGTPTANGGAITWQGTVEVGTDVVITYAAELTSTTVTTPTAVNRAVIDDGRGYLYTRTVMINGHYVYLPLVMRSYGQ